jgi:cell division protein FtsX
LFERRVSFLEKERKYHRKSAFTNGLAVGFGIGCFATFAALLVTAFYYSQMTSLTFESALSNFLLPLSYFFILGVLFLILGLVWERFEKQLKL